MRGIRGRPFLRLPVRVVRGFNLVGWRRSPLQGEVDTGGRLPGAALRLPRAGTPEARWAGSSHDLRICVATTGFQVFLQSIRRERAQRSQREEFIDLRAVRSSAAFVCRGCVSRTRFIGVHPWFTSSRNMNKL